jgi:hypothetical protein
LRKTNDQCGQSCFISALAVLAIWIAAFSLGVAAVLFLMSGLQLASPNAALQNSVIFSAIEFH